MKPFRLMDLDLLVQRGMKSRPFQVKARDKQVNLSAVQYVMERVMAFHAQNCWVCILMIDPNNTEEVVSSRDPLSRLCYEILFDKLETTGLCVKKFKRRQELEDFAYDLCNRGFRGVNPFSTVRAMVDCPKLYTLIGVSRAFAVDSGKKVCIDTYNSCDDELEVPVLSYPMLWILKEKFPDKYVDFYEEFVETHEPSADLALPITMANFIKGKMESGDITVTECVSTVESILALHDGLSEPIDYEQFQQFNRDGAVTLLTGFNLKTALELIGVFELNYTKQSAVINSYLKNKVQSYVDGNFSLDRGISVETDYFSEVSEKVVDKNGELVSDTRNDEFMSEEELLNEFL